MKRKFSYKTLNTWLKSRNTDWKLGKRYLQCYILRYWSFWVFFANVYLPNPVQRNPCQFICYIFFHLFIFSLWCDIYSALGLLPFFCRFRKRYLQCYILRYWNEAVFIEQKYEKFSNGRQFHQQQHESIISFFSFCHFIVSPSSIYGFWLRLWYFQRFCSFICIVS
jgi:hypothetical protein